MYKDVVNQSQIKTSQTKAPKIGKRTRQYGLSENKYYEGGKKGTKEAQMKIVQGEICSDTLELLQRSIIRKKKKMQTSEL